MDLRKRRKELGLTQADVARLCEVSLTTYLVWERRVGSPNEENKKKLVKALRLPEEKEGE